MPANPFAPPEAALDDPLAARPRRPLAIWLVLILAVAVGTLLAFGTLRVVVMLASGQWRVAPMLPGLGFRLTLLAGLVGAVIGAYRATAWGRWLGLAFIAGVLVVTVLSAILPGKDDGPIKRFQYTNQAAGEAGEVLGVVLFGSLESWWFFSFGFSRRARAYFGNATPGGAHHVPRS